MSWYTSFYIGWQDKDGKIRPLGPYDNYKNKLREIISTSRSFTTDLKELFYPIPEDAWTDELEQEFTYEDYIGKRRRDEYLGYLPLKDLPTGDFIKKGYFLIEDIDQYIRSQTDDDVYFEGFYETVSPEVYVRMMENELKFGPPKPSKDCEGNELPCYSCSDYSYFAYPDYHCKEYEAFILRTMANILADYDFPEDAQVVVLKTEG